MVGSVGVGDDVAARRAIRAFDVAEATRRGFDFGETQGRVRSAAEVRLSDVAVRTDATAASQAGNLLGILVDAAGRVAGGVTADARAQDAFTAAVRRDTANADAKYNLELLLRRTKATSTRHGAGTGAGSRGRGRRGAGAGTPGRGYWMTLAALTFATPYGTVAVLAGILPLAGLGYAARHSGRAASALGLEPVRIAQPPGARPARCRRLRLRRSGRRAARAQDQHIDRRCVLSRRSSM